MRALVQRVSRASVKTGDRVTGSIGPGLLIFLGITHGDGDAEIEYIGDKIANMRIFGDELGKMNLSLLDIKGQILIVSQFTLYGDCVKGRRPSFTEAAGPEKAKQVYDDFVRYMSYRYDIGVSTGEFAADMDVELVNSGPVTFMIESR
jgi:D-aminoacyl-tRNA deacylase